MTRIAFFYPVDHEAHRNPGHAERPERVEVIRKALDDAGYWAHGMQVSPEPLPDFILHSIHTEELLDTVRRHSELELNIDGDTYLTKQTWQLALNAAAGAAATAKAVWTAKADCGFALTRPPGHHATRTHAMGFCLLNNVALAAESLLKRESAQRLAIIDMDVHHGNGTQDIFYDRGDVLYISTHQSPLYPGTGRLAERGSGRGDGFTVNIPLPPGSGDAAFREAYGDFIPQVLDDFKPEMLLISIGFDSHWKDPLANLLVSANGYGEAVRSLQDWAMTNCGGRISLFLEGGYDLEALAAGALAVVSALVGEETRDELGPAPLPENREWQAVIEQLHRIRAS
ncbi:MAG: histone deacetylase family protein [Anaerolineales bacterium]